MRDRSEFMLLWPIAILTLAAMVLLGLSLAVGSRQVDAKVRIHEEQLIRRGIDGQVKAIETAMAGQTVWDAAVVNLDNKFDAKWADIHVAAYLRPVIGTWDYMVVDSDDHVVWANHDAGPMPREAWVPFARNAAPVIAEIRQMERRRGPLVRDPAHPELPIGKPITLTQVEPRDGRAYMWTASLVEPDFGTAKPRHATSAILIAGGFITVQNLSAIQQRYGLANAHFVRESRDVRPEEASTEFASIIDARPIILVWTPQRPSHDLLFGSIWLIMGVVLAFAALGLLMFRRTQKAAHDLFEIHRAQGEFLANMSHEIRTPLNGVNALADALTRTPLNAAQKAMAETIYSSGVMLERLLTDILDLARIDAGGMAVEQVTFNLAAAVTAAAALLEARAKSKRLELRLDLEPAADALVLGDPTRLRQILTNLISNAVKFTEAGHVALSVRRQEDGRWRFEVRDTGIGFDPAVKGRIFQRFQQADGSVTRRFGGSGLGLAISKELATKMGGTLDAESQPGRGAVFALVLPLPPADAALDSARDDPPGPSASGPAPQPAPGDDHLRVLVSEDHPVNRMVIEMLLRAMGAEILSTENGQEACEAFEAQSFDVILMDMQMPVMDGLTAIRRIRERERAQQLPRTPIVMVTANALPEHRTASLDAGADMFITKPVDGGRLADAIDQLRRPAAA